MVELIQSIVMAILQGIIEWLPISSEGQLTLLFISFLEMNELEAVTLSLLLHIGTMISVIWCFRDDFLLIIKNQNKKDTVLAKLILIITFGTGLSAVPIMLFFKNYWEFISQEFPIPTDILFSVLIGFLLIITGVILSKQPEKGVRELNSLTSKEALIVGIAQGFAALPGISRSGMTITVLLIIGLTQKDALRTSFIISVPAVLGATTLEFILQGFSIQANGLLVGSTEFPYWLFILTLSITALIGIFTMNALLKLRNIPYDKFCIGFGSGTILITLFIYIITLVWL